MPREEAKCTEIFRPELISVTVLSLLITRRPHYATWVYLSLFIADLHSKPLLHPRRDRA